MTALPKHCPSSRRQGRRRAAHQATKLPKTVKCPHCGQPKLPGYRCPNCKQ
jgi:ribosomal protein L32